MSELETLIMKADQGAQNRYGEIEYTYSEQERCMFISEIAYSLNHTLPTLNEQEKITSLLYWYMLGPQHMAQLVFSKFLPFITLPCVHDGFFRFFEENNAIESKLRQIEILLNLSKEDNQITTYQCFRDGIFQALKEMQSGGLNTKEHEKHQQLIGRLLY